MQHHRFLKQHHRFLKIKAKILHRSTNDVRILFEQDLAFKIIQDIKQLRQNSFWVTISAQVFQEFVVLSLVFVFVVSGCRRYCRRYCGVLLLFVVLPLLLRFLVLVFVLFLVLFLGLYLVLLVFIVLCVLHILVLRVLFVLVFSYCCSCSCLKYDICHVPCHFLWKFTCKMPDAPDTTSIDRRTFTITIRTPLAYSCCSGSYPSCSNVSFFLLLLFLQGCC